MTFRDKGKTTAIEQKSARTLRKHTKQPDKTTKSIALLKLLVFIFLNRMIEKNHRTKIKNKMISLYENRGPGKRQNTKSKTHKSNKGTKSRKTVCIN